MGLTLEDKPKEALIVRLITLYRNMHDMLRDRKARPILSTT